MSLNVLLTSQSKVKSEAVIEFFKGHFNKTIDLATIDCGACGLPEQPIIDDNNEGHHFAKERMNYAKKSKNFDNYDYVVAIESGISVGLNIEDVCYVLVYHKGILADGTSFGIPFELKHISTLEQNNKLLEYNKKIYGYSVTVGEIMNKEDGAIDPKNWMKTTLGINRTDQIKHGLKKCFEKLELRLNDKLLLMNAYKSYQDFPKDGVLFHDIFPLFKDSKLLRRMIKLIASQYKYDVIDYVVGLESRGFCLGTAIAFKLGVGFVPVRKEGKLPGKTIKLSYDKEYGKDTCEMSYEGMEGKRVLVIDDLVATGGSLKVALDLLEMLNCLVVDCCVLRDVPQLKDTYSKALDGCKYTIMFQ